MKTKIFREIPICVRAIKPSLLLRPCTSDICYDLDVLSEDGDEDMEEGKKSLFRRKNDDN